MSNSKKTDTPFESKPRLARKPSQHSPKSESPAVTPANSRPALTSESKAQMDFNPLGGVTFQKNRNSDVAIVGKGYTEDAHSDGKGANAKGKDRRGRNQPKGKPAGHIP